MRFSPLLWGQCDSRDSTSDSPPAFFHPHLLSAMDQTHPVHAPCPLPPPVSSLPLLGGPSSIPVWPWPCPVRSTCSLSVCILAGPAGLHVSSPQPSPRRKDSGLLTVGSPPPHLKPRHRESSQKHLLLVGSRRGCSTELSSHPGQLLRSPPPSNKCL